MKRLVIGILAHVDAGKTTLSESMLYLSGKIKEMGRVDHQDAHLDTHALERERGITIFSEQAQFRVGDTEITLLDTPGHVDFSAEMERTLHVLDYAILVISGADGVQAHTKTLWRLLALYEIPVFIFINKMDRPGTVREELLAELKKELGQNCVDFSPTPAVHFLEEIALCDEELIKSYLAAGDLTSAQIGQAVRGRKIFPCFFGSALTLDGVETFMRALVEYAPAPVYPEEFGAEVYKISRDGQGSRLTHLKIVGGVLRVRDAIKGEDREEKINEIRIYSGEKFSVVQELTAGAVCAVTGLTTVKPGQAMGIGIGTRGLVLEPVLSYQVVLPANSDPREILPRLRELEEEEPELRIVWDEELQEIQAQLMGEMQIEILESLIESRFGLRVHFGAGKILYKETIANTVEGVGHFEPLRHYAEVQLLLEPGEPGSGLQYVTKCSEDVLAGNWQRLILTHLKEKTQLGVLTGSPITDLRITLVGGRASVEHTVGGDFREATYRAVRQGLKEAQSILLEPYYSYQLEVPTAHIGRAIIDLERLHATYEIRRTSGDLTVLSGRAPVVMLRHYQREVTAYTGGNGRIFCSFEGYGPCHNAAEVIARMGYDSEQDAANPTGSIFCTRGTGSYVPWNRVKDHMHGQRYLRPDPALEERREVGSRANDSSGLWEDIDYELLERTTSANRGRKRKWRRQVSSVRAEQRSQDDYPRAVREDYLLVDGYNIIHAWDELKEFADGDMDVARQKLLDALASYAGMAKRNIIVVFDAYRVAGQMERVGTYHNLRVVFTKEAQTADQFIEKFAYEHRKEYRITVATSDGLQQIIIRGAGCILMTAKELRAELERAKIEVAEFLGAKSPVDGTSLLETPTGLVIKKIMEEKNKKKGDNK